MNTSELRVERHDLVHRSRAIIERADAQSRPLTSDESAQFDRMMNRYDSVKRTIDREDRARNEVTRREASGEASSARMVAYRKWLSTGDVDVELRKIQPKSEYRDTVVSTDSKGGYLVAPVEISNDVSSVVANRVWVRSMATVTQVTAAKKLGVRKRTARMSDADWTTEVSVASEDTTQAFGRRDLEPQLVSKLAKCSMRALAISVLPEKELNDELAYKFAVTEEKAFITGNGSGKPLGVYVADASGISTARDLTASSATAFTADDLVDMKFTLVEAYLNDPSLAWLVSREFIRRARKLKVASTTGGDDLQYIWQPGLTEGAPDRILDIPYHMSEFAPNTFTTGLYTAVLGAWRHYRIAELNSMLVQRLDETYALTNEIGFIGRRWVDGAPILEEAFVRLKMG